jgi:hypothetical protein
MLYPIHSSASSRTPSTHNLQTSIFLVKYRPTRKMRAVEYICNHSTSSLRPSKKDGCHNYTKAYYELSNETNYNHLSRSDPLKVN